VDTEKKANAAAKDRDTHMASPSDIDTSDDSDTMDEEYQLWMRREAARIRREESMRDPAAARLAAQQRATAPPATDVHVRSYHLELTGASALSRCASMSLHLHR
jgi:hypothetical protein